MATTVDPRVAAVHPKSLKAQGECDRKKIAALVERALELVGISKQDAAFRMGYSDSGTVSRWCSALERPHMDKLFALDGFEDAWVWAMAEQNPRMEVVRQVVIRDRRHA